MEIEALFAQSLHGEYDDDEPWKAVSAVQRIGSREVFDEAALWCRSQDALRRARGADVLAQLGKTANHPTNKYPDESFAIMANMVATEQNSLPLSSAINALGHIDDPRAVPIIALHSSHSVPDVRFAVASALGIFANDPFAAPVLIQLMSDVDADVRDWATFGLGVLGRADSPEIRNALAARLNDPDVDTREEAMVGLAKRRDRRVLSPLMTSLETVPPADRAIEAAHEMLGLQNEQGDGWTAIDYFAALREKFGT